MNMDDSVYIKQLAELGESREVTASEDIRAENGTKLITRGTQINRAVLDRLLRHKLLKPIDYTTTVRDSIDRGALTDFAREMMARDSEMGELLRRLQDRDFPRRVFQRVELLPMVRNKLTLAQQLYPALFNHSMMVALGVSSLGERLGRSEPELSVLATAGLVHDIGALHIEVTGLDQNQQLQDEHWRQIYSHSRIGAMILEAFPQYRPHVTRAVLEHHERMDGSGYPRGLRGNEISPAGRMLSFADFVCATAQKKGFMHTITIVKTHPRAFEKPLVQELVRVMREYREALQPSAARLDAEHLGAVLKDLAGILTNPLPLEHGDGTSGPAAGNLEWLHRDVTHIRLMMHRAGYAISDAETCIRNLEGDAEIRAELESLLREAHFLLNRSLLELNRRNHASNGMLDKSRELDAWVEAARSCLLSMDQRLQA